jgi:hypothetical protein
MVTELVKVFLSKTQVNKEKRVSGNPVTKKRRQNPKSLEKSRELIKNGMIYDNRIAHCQGTTDKESLSELTKGLCPG